MEAFYIDPVTGSNDTVVPIFFAAIKHRALTVDDNADQIDIVLVDIHGLFIKAGHDPYGVTTGRAFDRILYQFTRVDDNFRCVAVHCVDGYATANG